MTIAVVLALGIAASPSVAQQALDPVAACVRDNLIRYAPPDRAVVDQYLSLESACRERIESQGGAQVDVSPIGGGGADGGGRGPGPGAGAGSGGEADRGVRGGAGSSRGPAGGQERAPGAGGPATPAEPVVSSRVAVLAALDGAETAGPAGPSGLLKGPPWLLSLVGAAIVSVAVAAWSGARSRPR
jgi:hypothetical protein